MTDWCPQCIGVRKDRYSPLESTIRYKRKKGYKYCLVCGRRWPTKKSEIPLTSTGDGSKIEQRI